MNILAQYIVNLLVMLDHVANTLLLGDPDETLSARIARARAAGHVWAKVACKILSVSFRIITFGKLNRDHCAYSVDNSVLPASKEIWNWSDNKIEIENVIQNVELARAAYVHDNGRLGKKHKAETKALMSAQRTGKKFTAIQKANMSASTKAAWQRRKIAKAYQSD